MGLTNRITRHILLFLLFLPAAVMAAGDIQFTSTAEVEVQQVNAKGEQVTVRQPADLVQPGGMVIYTNAFTNTGKKAAEKVVINNPVPVNTEYLGGSASETGFDVVFSVDKGKSFGKPKDLTVPDVKGGRRPAEPKDYTDIRWTMLSALKPGATGVVEFRVRVK